MPKLTARPKFAQNKRYYSFPKIPHGNREFDLHGLSNGELYAFAKACGIILQNRERGDYDKFGHTDAKELLEKLAQFYQRERKIVPLQTGKLALGKGKVRTA